MSDLIDDLSAVVAKHSSNLTGQEWMDACQRVMLGYFAEGECQNLIDADALLEAVRRGVKGYLQSQDAMPGA